jgi:hypothetical protein
MLFAFLLAVTLPFAQSWTDTALIVADDDWSGVPGVVGYRGDGLAVGAGANPQTIVLDGSGTPVDVIANQTNPDSLFAGGVVEFELEDPAVALQGSGSADAPHLVLSLDTRGYRNVRLSYQLRDLDGSGDDAVQPVALQYRIGGSGDYVNVAGGFVFDATAGPGLAGLATAVGATLPADADNRPLVEVRIMTANAADDDEWVGIDDLGVTGTAVDVTPPELALAVAARQRLARALRGGVAARFVVGEPVTLRSELRLNRRLARRRGLRLIVGVASARVAEPGRLITRFSARARRRLARLELVKVVLRVSAIDEAGNPMTVSRRVTLVG